MGSTCKYRANRGDGQKRCMYKGIVTVTEGSYIWTPKIVIFRQLIVMYYLVINMYQHIINIIMASWPRSQLISTLEPNTYLSETRLLKLLSLCPVPGPNHMLALLSGTCVVLSRRITFRTSGSVLWKCKGREEFQTRGELLQGCLEN